LCIIAGGFVGAERVAGSVAPSRFQAQTRWNDRYLSRIIHGKSGESVEMALRLLPEAFGTGSVGQVAGQFRSGKGHARAAREACAIGGMKILLRRLVTRRRALERVTCAFQED